MLELLIWYSPYVFPVFIILFIIWFIFFLKEIAKIRKD